MVKKTGEAAPRDDAEEQPESGYAGGRLNTKPSADPPESDPQRAHERRSGSESEFDSEKPRSQ